MIRSKSIFSIVVIITFILADQLELKGLIPGGYYFRSAIIYLTPALIGIATLFLFHQPAEILEAIGMRSGFWTGLKWAFIFTLPMLIGYAILGGWNEAMTFRKFYWMAILAPLAEEVFFRGYLFGQLHRFGGWGFFPAAFLSAIIFGSMHLYQANDWSTALGVFAVTGMGGAWFAWLYVSWNNNLWLSIFLHFFMNTYWGIFGIADNALGGTVANIFRVLTIAVSIFMTFYFIKKDKIKGVNKSQLWSKSSHQEDTVQDAVIPIHT